MKVLCLLRGLSKQTCCICRLTEGNGCGIFWLGLLLIPSYCLPVDPHNLHYDSLCNLALFCLQADRVYGCGIFWLGLLLIPFLALLRDITWKV